MRLLFASIGSYIDLSSGAALCTKELLELLASRGMDCRALCAGVLDHERDATPGDVVASVGLPTYRFQEEQAAGRSAEATLINLQPSKGMTVFARVATELNRKKPGEGKRDITDIARGEGRRAGAKGGDS